MCKIASDLQLYKPKCVRTIWYTHMKEIWFFRFSILIFIFLYEKLCWKKDNLKYDFQNIAKLNNDSCERANHYVYKRKSIFFNI